MTNQTGELLQERADQKWITDADQRADHPGQTLLTRDRTVIRRWAQARGAEPATGVGKVNIQDGGAAIRFAFPGVGRLQPISWEDWFENFDQYNLVFAFEELTEEGLQSHKYRLVRTENLHHYEAAGAPTAGERSPMQVPPSPPSAQTHGEHRATRRKTGWRRALSFFGVGKRRDPRSKRAE